MIQGWILGLQGMKTGGKRRLSVPAAQAYGERQIGTMIPPHSDLLFEIELLEVLTRDDYAQRGWKHRGVGLQPHVVTGNSPQMLSCLLLLLMPAFQHFNHVIER